MQFLYVKFNTKKYSDYNIIKNNEEVSKENPSGFIQSKDPFSVSFAARRTFIRAMSFKRASFSLSNTSASS